jgi:hypothetical protein
MKTMGLIPDVLTSGEKFDSGPGSQRIYRTLSPRLTAEVEKIAQISWVGSCRRESGRIGRIEQEHGQTPVEIATDLDRC